MKAKYTHYDTCMRCMFFDSLDVLFSIAFQQAGRPVYESFVVIGGIVMKNKAFGCRSDSMNCPLHVIQ